MYEKKNSLAYEAYLAHHGILGQKWGIRRYQNPDGTLTAAGRARYRMSDSQKEQIQKRLSDSNYNEDISEEVFKISNADMSKRKEAYKILEENANEQKEITKLYKQLFKGLDKDDTYYEAVSEISNYIGSGWKDADSLTLDDMAMGSYMGLFEDGQQSSINAESMYTYKKGIQHEVHDLLSRSNDSNKAAKDAASKIVQSALDEVGGENLKAYEKNDKLLASEQLVYQMMNSKRFDDWETISSGNYMLYQANNANSFTQKDKDAIKTVENFASHIKNNNDENTWYLLNEAIQNLGISNSKCKDLSQSDWNKINAEIKKLRDDGGGW